jgi:hypothetical protein
MPGMGRQGRGTRDYHERLFEDVSFYMLSDDLDVFFRDLRTRRYDANAGFVNNMISGVVKNVYDIGCVIAIELDVVVAILKDH